MGGARGLPSALGRTLRDGWERPAWHVFPELFSGNFPGPARSRQSGFSLLETLVAFSILAICLGTLLRIFGGGGHAAALTDEYARGLTVAESLMASLGTEMELVPGRRQGVVAGSIRWEMQVSPMPVQSEHLSSLNFAFSPVWVEVTASWGDQSPRSVKLHTIRLLPAKGGDSPLNTPPQGQFRHG